ncbi:hypothetical protein ACWKSP_31270 [Micromonosporaceae bacterium Da 78-11]
MFELFGDIGSAQDDEGNLTPAEAKKIISKFGATMTRAGASAGDSRVATAVRHSGSVATKAGASPDPEKVLETGVLETANKQLEDACKAAGAPLSGS